MPSPYLSKTDFKAAFECSTKLYYRRLGYPSTLADNEYLRFLADSGFMVEAVAKAQFPQGKDLTGERDPQRAYQRTRELLSSAEDAVVFEGGFIHGRLYARADILRREGKTLHLIEVKSSSWNPEKDSADFLTKKGSVDTKWKPYLIDVTFQRHVLEHAFPDFEIQPWLWVVDKSQPVRECETVGRFSIIRTPGDTRARPQVCYSGGEGELRGTRLFARREVSAATDRLMPEVIHRAGELVSLMADDGRLSRPRMAVHQVYKICRNCEYRFREIAPDAKHGFAECWGEMASASPHILDLHKVTLIGSTNLEDPVPVLLSQRKASLLDLNEEQLGSPGTRMERRRMQWANSAHGGREYLPEALKRELRGFEAAPGYPYHFVDFEACDVVLPHHAGLCPYERVAFQWSCHTLEAGGELTHREWLNTERSFPSFKFVRELRACIGDTGTVFVWSHYEQTTLCKILGQLEQWMRVDLAGALSAAGLNNVDELRDLAAWIKGLLGPKNGKGKGHHSPRIRDLHQLAETHYFHPLMLGRTSIKAVLPAVWQSSESLRQHPWFARHHRWDDQGHPLDPYKTLAPLPLADRDEEDAVREGTGAIRVYQELIFLQDVDALYRENRETLLKQYCELDTAAMVMIWAHWTGFIPSEIPQPARS
jgi:hypothetical protein